jgi:hypothetical protein
MLNGKHSIMIHESQFPFEFLPTTLDGAYMVSKRIELLSIYGFQIFISLTFRVRLVHSNDYYTVIGISITRNRISCNGISIIIHQFGNNR